MALLDWVAKNYVLNWSFNSMRFFILTMYLFENWIKYHLVINWYFEKFLDRKTLSSN